MSKKFESYARSTIYFWTKFILITDTDRSLDWETRHGRGVALSVAAKEAPDKVLTDEYKKRVINAASEISQADRVC